MDFILEIYYIYTIVINMKKSLPLIIVSTILCTLIIMAAVEITLYTPESTSITLQFISLLSGFILSLASLPFLFFPDKSEYPRDLLLPVCVLNICLGGIYNPYWSFGLFREFSKNGFSYFFDPKELFPSRGFAVTWRTTILLAALIFSVLIVYWIIRGISKAVKKKPLKSYGIGTLILGIIPVIYLMTPRFIFWLFD